MSVLFHVNNVEVLFVTVASMLSGALSVNCTFHVGSTLIDYSLNDQSFFYNVYYVFHPAGTGCI